MKHEAERRSSGATGNLSGATGNQKVVGVALVTA
jgi:hypothetical protein